MQDSRSLDLMWIKVGITAGFLTLIIYPLLIFMPMPRLVTVILVFAVGPLLSMTSRTLRSRPLCRSLVFGCHNSGASLLQMG
jgi:hypothetical protein